MKALVVWVYVCVGIGVGFSTYDETKKQTGYIDNGSAQFAGVLMTVVWPVALGTLVMSLQKATE